MKIFNKIAYYGIMRFPRLAVIVLVLCVAILFFNGCSTTKIVEKPITVVDTVETPKPVPCKVEGLYCSFDGTQYIPTMKLLQCLIIHKRIIEICSGKNKTVPFDASQDRIKEYLDNELYQIEKQLYEQK